MEVFTVKEVAEYQDKFTLNIDGNKLQFVSPEGKVLSEVTVFYATESSHAESSDSSTVATSAGKATNDKNDKDITTYLASVSSENNVITFTNGAGETVGSVSLVTGENVVVTIKNTSGNYGSLFNVLRLMTVTPESASDFSVYEFESDYSFSEILALIKSGNTIMLRHEHDIVIPDSENDPFYDSVMPIELTYSSHPDLSIVQENYLTFGWFYGSSQVFNPATANWKQFFIEAGTTDDYIKIRIVRE